MRVCFRGTRGSIPKPGSATLRHGGNTSCVEVRTADGTLLVLDCGTGAHELGRDLAASGEGRVGHLLIGHMHWDHIQGFPFFSPLFVRGNDWHVYAPGGGRDPREALSAQMEHDYSPITIEAMHADLHFHRLTEGSFDAGGARIRTQFLNHPALGLAYRIEADGATLVYATDHEPHSLYPLDAPPGTPPLHHEDRRHVRLLENADLVIHDGQYRLDDFPARAGWGHAPVERAVDYAILAGARRLALTHHDPDRDDEAVDRLCWIAQERAAAAGSALEVFAAAEGRVLEISGAQPHPHRPIAPERSALLSEPSTRDDEVLVVDDDPDMVALLEAALATAGVSVSTAGDGESAVEIARRHDPALILLDMNLPGQSGLDVCRTLRAERNPHLRDVPIVMLTGERLKEGDLVQAFAAGATDYLTKPVKPTLVRSRVRGWLLRRARPSGENDD